MFIDFLVDVFKKHENQDAIIWKDRVYSYGWLLDRVHYWQDRIKGANIQQGTVAVLEADFSANSIALFLALAEKACILVPLASSMGAKKDEFVEIAQAEASLAIDEDDNVRIGTLPYIGKHELYDRLEQIKHPGLVLFSSGSTGKSKAILHDLSRLLGKFQVPRHSWRTISFLLYDHIGGINTVLYVLSNAGCLVTVQDRSPDAVLATVERYKVELLPTSPTFINLILISEAYKRYDLSSLQTVTYGTEPMPETTLKRFHQLFPHIRLLQTYGLSELGILRSKSKSSDSTWLRVGGEEFDTRVVNGTLQIKAQSSMLGYLNAPSPFTEDGWFNTEDVVEVDGEFMRFRGRDSEIINVGGEKVFPTEVESVLLQMDNVKDATVCGESNSILGNIVVAKINLVEPENLPSLRKRVREFCRDRMAPYKVPIKIEVTEDSQFSARLKKMRSVKL